jgi:hypothetical protein
MNLNELQFGDNCLSSFTFCFKSERQDRGKIVYSLTARCVRARARRMPCRTLSPRLRGGTTDALSHPDTAPQGRHDGFPVAPWHRASGEAPSVFTRPNRELEIQPTRLNLLKTENILLCHSVTFLLRAAMTTEM